MDKRPFTVSTALALALSAPASWAPAAHAQQQAEPEIAREIDIVTWMEAYEELQGEGWSAEWMHEQPVYGADGNEIGEVESLLVGADGGIESLIIETGGVIGVGDVPVRIPWEEVELTEDGRIVADVTEENLPNFELFDDEPEPGPRAFRAHELIGDRVRLEDEPEFGYVADVLFNRDGELAAVIVSPSYAYGERHAHPYGYYAYLYYGYGALPGGEEYYDLPYTTDEAAELPPFDYEGPGVGEG